MKVITGEPEETVKKDVDSKALRVFFKAIDFLGGPRKLFEYRNLTWLPSLMSASYVIVLSQDYLKTADEIASELGLSKNTVQNILRAKPEYVEARFLKEEEVNETTRTHTAGGLAKLAYEAIQMGDESINFLRSFFSSFERSIYKIPWPTQVLDKVEGVDFPAEKEVLVERLKGVDIEGKKAEEILEKIEYPVRSPAELLHKISQVIKE